MVATEDLVSALDAAIVSAEGAYRSAVVALATAEADKSSSTERELADVDEIHHARTRVIALHAAREELVTHSGDRI
ncbi:hypothetical protein WG901_22790 [Novosphingobium sp. PS1R-30]|uniref:DUF2383 domain-containing protein n=1 Tax=Novosphingobium anseongense TaxID=3133436 RepID=A0ABU8S2C1_9SPHN